MSQNKKEDNNLKKVADVVIGAGGAGVTAGVASAIIPGASLVTVGAAMLTATGSRAFGETFKVVLNDISQKALTPSETKRLSVLVQFTAQNLKDAIDNGQRIREDDFFQTQEYGFSNCEELAQYILTKAKDELEVRKLQFLGYFLASLMLRADISAGTSNSLLKEIERLTYRQLCILSLMGQRIAVLSSNYIAARDDNTKLDAELDAFQKEHLEVFESWARQSLNAPDSNGEVVLELSDYGKTLYEMMRLDKIPPLHINEIKELYKRAAKIE